MMPGLGQITLLQADGRFTSEEFEKALALAVKAIKKIYRVQKEALKRRYIEISKEVLESEQ